MGQWLREQGRLPDLILALLARQTAEAVAMAPGWRVPSTVVMRGIWRLCRGRPCPVAALAGGWLSPPLPRPGKLMTCGAALAWFAVLAGMLRVGSGHLRGVWRPADPA